MPVSITLTTDQINRIDISEAEQLLDSLRDDILNYEQQLSFTIAVDREPGDPREWSEIPEVRLWFIRLDACYPWLPFLLDWRSGELARYTAMLVPHQFHPKDGIQFNPEALEIFVMHKTFTLLRWMRSEGIEGRSRIKAMAKVLGYELEDGFFDLLGDG
ncbi:CRR6 family NdhI maturation factor [Alkalinema sp. FACHB-956]|uniref:CRR6 family NdhI maturation factor n=1 Tax=Alkalinema sp. FACHB-956 TaxID=2692768 RepID=UPI001685EC8E|nr:CRR6 family NdhI maturation factor [Alkalinema sp. FACHB-956]MBD2325446.1 CRR6 family NdhI maturation factor [Alkalinema sp. FACHB-956]